MKMHTKLLLLLALVVPSCSLADDMFTQAADPEITVLAAELEEAYAAAETQYNEVMRLREQLGEAGLTIESAELIITELGAATGRYEAISANIASVRVKLDEKESQEGVPWYVALGGALIALAVPTLNGIPIVGPLVSSVVSEKLLQKAGLRNEETREAQRYKGPEDLVPIKRGEVPLV